MLFVGDQVWENFNEAAMPHLEGIIELKNFDLVVSRSQRLTYAREHLNEEFGKRYPCRFRADNVSYRRRRTGRTGCHQLHIGTTGYSKGVMLPYRSIISNVVHIHKKSRFETWRQCGINVAVRTHFSVWFSILFME